DRDLAIVGAAEQAPAPSPTAHPDGGAPASANAPLPSALEWARQSVFPFAGRDRELAEMNALWDETLATSLRHGVLIGGEPGIGKTRLAAEAALAATTRQ